MAKTKIKTRNIRFQPDPGTLAQICFGPQKEGQPPETLYGLVLNESSTGFAVVLMTDRKFKVGTTCDCKVGHLAKTVSTVRWTKVLERGLLKVGLEYEL